MRVILVIFLIGVISTPIWANPDEDEEEIVVDELDDEETAETTPEIPEDTSKPLDDESIADFLKLLEISLEPVHAAIEATPRRARKNLRETLKIFKELPDKISGFKTRKELFEATSVIVIPASLTFTQALISYMKSKSESITNDELETLREALRALEDATVELFDEFNEERSEDVWEKVDSAMKQLFGHGYQAIDETITYRTKNRTKTDKTKSRKKKPSEEKTERSERIEL
ncbi:hypothetical protein DMENIID0001_148400 [Sergentomyia squamirostris]